MARSVCAASRWPTPVSAEQARRGQDGFVDRRVRILLQIAQEPADRDPLVTARIFPCNQHRQLERIEQIELRELLRGGQRREHVPALQRPLEDHVWMALRGRRSSSLGARRPNKLMGLFPLVGGSPIRPLVSR
jgi:hypothetical protein